MTFHSDDVTGFETGFDRDAAVARARRIAENRVFYSLAATEVLLARDVLALAAALEEAERTNATLRQEKWSERGIMLDLQKECDDWKAACEESQASESDLMDELAAARQQVETLREALTPFVDALNILGLFEGEWNDEPDDAWWSAGNVQFGDMRRARAALGAAQEQADACWCSEDGIHPKRGHADDHDLRTTQEQAE